MAHKPPPPSKDASKALALRYGLAPLALVLSFPRMFRILDRYLIRQILAPFTLALLVFTFLLMLQPMMGIAEGLIAKGVASGTILRMMATLVPQALGVTIPMALLVGILIGLGRLSGDRETVAMQACGISVYRLLRPIVALAVVAAAACAYTLIVSLPDANQSFREISFNIVASRAEQEVKPRVFFVDFPDVVMYVRDVPSEGGWDDVFLADTRQGDQPDIYIARRGRMVTDRAKRRVEVLLDDATSHRVDPDQPDTYTEHTFNRGFIALNPDAVFPRTGPQRGLPELTIRELQDEVVSLRQQGLPPHQPIMYIHRKFSLPAACLVFALIGVALGVTSRKDGKLASFVLGIGVIFAYYIIMYGAEALAKGGLVSPHLAMWLPNLVIGAAGLVLLLWRSRSSERRIWLPGTVSVPLPSWKPTTATQTSGAGHRPTTKRVVIVIRFPQLLSWRLNLLDRYVTRLYLRIVALSFVGLMGIFYISTFIDLSDKLYKGEATGWMLIEYFWFATPQYIYYVVPISALIATLVAIGLLTKSSELTVMKACGISLYRAAAPLLLFGMLWSGLMFVLQESVLASANRRAEAIRHVIRGGSPRTFDVLNRQWLIGRDGAIYHYRYFEPKVQEMSGLTVYRFAPEDWQLSSRLFASHVRYTEEGWLASTGWEREFDGDLRDDTSPYRRFENQVIDVEPPSYFVTEQPAAERMTYRQLDDYIGELSASGFNVVALTVALQRKLSFPFVTIIMTLIGVPFAVTTGRRGALYGIGLGIMLAISYWITFSVFAAIGSAGLLAPMLAAWAPNGLFGSLGTYLALTVRT